MDSDAIRGGTVGLDADRRNVEAFQLTAAMKAAPRTTTAFSGQVDRAEMSGRVPGSSRVSHVVVVISNWKQPPITPLGRSFIRLLGVETSLERANELKAKLQSQVEGTLRVFPTGTWIPLMASAKEQDDADLCDRHTKAVLALAAWRHNLKTYAFALPPAQIKSVMKAKQAFRPLDIPVPVPGVQKRALDVDAGDEAKGVEGAGAAARRDGLNVIPDACREAIFQQTYTMISAIHDVTAKEPLWRYDVDKELKAALGPDNVPSLPHPGIFTDEVPRPLVRIYPVRMNNRTPPSLVGKCRDVIQSFVSDMDIVDMMVGCWINPQQLESQHATASYQSEADRAMESFFQKQGESQEAVIRRLESMCAKNNVYFPSGGSETGAPDRDDAVAVEEDLS